MKLSISTTDQRLTVVLEESPRHSPRELVAAMPLDIRAAEQISSLVSKLVGITVHDAIVRELGGSDGS